MQNVLDVSLDHSGGHTEVSFSFFAISKDSANQLTQIQIAPNCSLSTQQCPY